MAQPPHEPTVPAMIRALAERSGDRPLAVGAGRSLSYRDAERESAALARGLLAAGVGKGTRVGLMMPNSPDWIVAWLAALRIGALVTGISTFLKPPELAWVLRFADLDTLLTSDRYLRHDYVENLERALPGLSEQDGATPLRLRAAPYLRSIWLFGESSPRWCRGQADDLVVLAEEEPAIDDDFLERVEAEVSPADLGIVIFTSGSQADPKGVVHSQGTLVRQAYAVNPYGPFRENERVGGLAPFFWIGGMLTTLLDTMIAGATLFLPERPDPETVLELIREHDVDYLTGWAGQLLAIREHPTFHEDDFLRLRPAQATQRRSGLVGPTPDVPLDRLPNSLGMSETFGPHSGELDGTVLSSELAGSFGRAIGGTESGIERRIVEPRTGHEVAAGETGELFVRGHSLMQGYYKKEREETFETDGFFRTEDLCSLGEDGHLFFHGRGGEMIKTRGANVSPREIEIALESHPDVLEAIVLGQPDDAAGERVVALVVSPPGTLFDESALIADLRERLSDYKIPKRIACVAGDQLPRTTNGKVQKFKLLGRIDALLDPPPAD